MVEADENRQSATAYVARLAAGYPYSTPCGPITPNGVRDASSQLYKSLDRAEAAG